MTPASPDPEPIDDEDEDEDALNECYLRLMALKSLPEAKDVSANGNGEQFFGEMVELLDEAHQAAEETIDQPDSDEEQKDKYMLEVVNGGSENHAHLIQRLRNALARNKEPQPPDDGRYSPTENPLIEEEIEVSDFDACSVASTVSNGAPTPTVDEPPLPPDKPVDMELGSENEAEIQFFKDQRKQMKSDSLFPQSVWEFGAGKPPSPPLPPPPAAAKDQVPGFNDDQERYTAFLQAVINSSQVPDDAKRKRKRSRKLSEVNKDDDADDEEEEDVDKLRASLLSKMQEKRALKVSTDLNKPPPKEDEVKKEQVVEEPKKTVVKLDTKKIPTLINRQVIKKKIAEKIKPVVPQNTKLLKAKRLKERREAAKVAKAKAAAQVRELSKLKDEAVRLKHFPNLAKSVIIPPCGNTTTDDEADVPPPKPLGQKFASSLDMFMRQVRVQTAKKPVKKVATPKAAVSVLPLKKQKEYQRLKAKLAQMEQQKKAKQANNLPQSKPCDNSVPPAKPKNTSTKPPAAKTTSKKTAVDDDDDPEVLRRKLLSSMNGKTVQEDIMNVNENSNETAAMNQLKSKETDLSAIRKHITDDLFKLSAQLSQLNSEKEKKQTAEAFLADLKRQVSETQALIARKDDRINQLKHVVLMSHKQVSSRRKEIVKLEGECRTIGKKLVNADYKPPQENSREIKNKIALIQKNAKRMQVKAQAQPAPAPERHPMVAGPSALDHLRVGSKSESGPKIDPHVEFCPFELEGKCNDDQCKYQHPA